MIHRVAEEIGACAGIVDEAARKCAAAVAVIDTQVIFGHNDVSMAVKVHIGDRHAPLVTDIKVAGRSKAARAIAEVYLDADVPPGQHDIEVAVFVEISRRGVFRRAFDAWRL